MKVTPLPKHKTCSYRELAEAYVDKMDNVCHFLEVLSLPVPRRCLELTLLFERASLKELASIYPILLHSIFGGTEYTGWDLRMMTSVTHPMEYDILYNFFAPFEGPMFRVCYRLLNDSLKFDLPVAWLSKNLRLLFESGNYPPFYRDAVKVSPYGREIVALSLNAFEYFFFNFTLHGVHPHQRSTVLQQIRGTDRPNTLYYNLSALYICTFLPAKPEVEIQPENICQTAKQPFTFKQSMQRATRNLLLSTTMAQYAYESPSAYYWRSESVLHIFVDTWLRLDAEDSRNLPETELIRCIRVLVKQVHYFGNSANCDNTSIVMLRSCAQRFVSAQIYNFMRSIISRWPLDDTFSDVLELWLSYIQPWRYVYNYQKSGDDPIEGKFENFIADNVTTYTQIFAQMIPRYGRMDLTTYRNAVMLLRLVKVFGQSNLVTLIKRHEPFVSKNRAAVNSNPSMLPDNRFNSNIDFNYIFLFEEPFLSTIKALMQKIYQSMLMTERNVFNLVEEKKSRHKTLHPLLCLILNYFENDPVYDLLLRDSQQTPQFLETSLTILARLFQIEVNNAFRRSAMPNYSGTATADEHMLTNRFLEHSIVQRRLQYSYSVDPQSCPTSGAELAFVARFLHVVSSKLNMMFGTTFDNLWKRQGFLGKLSRQVLLAPMEEYTFDKSFGDSKLCIEHLGARITFRFLASYTSFGIIICAFLLGQLFFNAPSYGIIILVIFTIVYLMLRSFITNE